MKIDPAMTAAINAQIRAEYESALLYQQMSCWLKARNFKGFGNWFAVQTREELDHAQIFINYLLDCGQEIALGTVAGPKTGFENPAEIFKLALAAEEKVTANINALLDLAVKTNDHATRSRLQWFIDEQVEEEANASEMAERVAMVGNSGAGLLALDHQAEKRAYGVASALESGD